jgi:hypothetical protein
MKPIEQETPIQAEQFDSQQLKSVVEASWSKISFVNSELIVRPDVRALFTFCPLYAPGSLSESELLTNPTSIEESRVGVKWYALQRILKEINNYLKSAGGGLELVAIFANRGVLLSHESTAQDAKALEAHDSLYQNAVAEFCQTNGINSDYHNYDDLNVDFPRFVDPQAEIPIETPKEILERIKSETAPGDMIDAWVIWQLNQYLQEQGVPTQVENTPENFKVIRKLLGMGLHSSFWLVAGYLAFDYRIPELVGENGVYLVTERLKPLFGIASLTKGLENIPRADIST